MAVTVTATSSGAGALNGILLALRVVNNAAAVQNGATAASITVTTPQLAITPHATGSFIYGAILEGGTTVLTSLDANTTSLYNANDATNSFVSAAYRSTVATASTSPATYGWAAPTLGGGSWAVAAAEILSSGGTIAEDASTPATSYNASGKTATTASFSPPAASVLVAAVTCNTTGGAVTAVTVTDSAGAYAWTELAGVGPLYGSPAFDIASVWAGVHITASGSPPSPVPQLFLPPGAQGAGRFTPWLPWQDVRPPVAQNAAVIVSRTGTVGGAVPGLMVPGGAVPGAVPGAAGVVTAQVTLPRPVVTATAVLVLPPAANCAWVRSSYY